LLDSALARSMAAAVQRWDHRVDHASACWEDRVRGERLDRGAASLDFRGSRTWAVLFSNLPADTHVAASGAETGRFWRTDPLNTSSPQIQRFLLIALAVLFAASFTAAFASPVAFWASPFSSWAAPSALSLSDPTTFPIPCFTLPAASFARAARLVRGATHDGCSYVAKLTMVNVGNIRSFRGVR